MDVYSWKTTTAHGLQLGHARRETWSAMGVDQPVKVDSGYQAHRGQWRHPKALLFTLGRVRMPTLVQPGC